MEYLLLGGLAYAGQQYAKQTSTLPKDATLHQDPRRNDTNSSRFVPNSTPNSTPLTVADTYTAFANRMNRHMDDENTVNVDEPLTNHNMPFFKSERSQNTNDALKDRRLSTFTGVNTMDFQHKKEVEAPKPTRDLTNVNGSLAQVDQERYLPLATVKNNVLPFEQVKVGPGLGLKADEVATGGFHQNVRVLPGNVNGYRKHNYKGRTLAGKSAVDQLEQTIDVDVTKRTPLTETYRGLGARQSTVQGTRSRASEIFRNTCRGNDLNIHSNTAGVNATYVAENPTRDRSSLTTTNYVGNPQSERIGQPTATTHLLHSTERGNCNTHLLNANGAGSRHGTYSSVSNFDAATQREMMTDGPTNTVAVPVNAPSTVRAGYDAKPTQKLLAGDYVGGASRTMGSYVEKADAKPTLRGTHNGDVLAGPSMARVSANASYDYAYDGSRQVTMREDTLVSDYMPNFNGLNQPLDPSTTQSQYKVEHRENKNLYSSTVAHGLNIPSDVGLQSTRRSDGANRRDFGFTPSILATNDLAIDITKQFDRS